MDLTRENTLHLLSKPLGESLYTLLFYAFWGSSLNFLCLCFFISSLELIGNLVMPPVCLLHIFFLFLFVSCEI